MSSSGDTASFDERLRAWLRELLAADAVGSTGFGWDDPDDPSKAQITAIRSLATRSQASRTSWNNHCLVAAVAHNLQALQPVDMYRSVREEFGDITALMNLNQKQKESVQGMGIARGGFMCCQGPPGTGKTHLSVEIAKPFIMSKDFHQVMYLVSADTRTHSTAQKLNKMISKLEADEKLKRKGVYALCHYWPDPEYMIHQAETHDPFESGIIHGPVDWTELDAATTIFTKQAILETKPLHMGHFSHIQDKRDLFPEMSAAAKMLEITGVIQGPHTDPDVTRWAQFRLEHSKYSRDEPYNRQAFVKAVKEAMEYTIQNASVLIAVTYSADLIRIISVVKDTLELIIADDAAREIECSYLPLFAAQFTKVRGFFMTGDFFQHEPAVRKTSDRPFAEREKLSFMYRMCDNGFRSYELAKQYRMNEELCNAIKTSTYRTTFLDTDESALIRNRPLSQAFATWAGDRHNNKACNITIDVLTDDANRTRLTSSDSMENDHYASLMIDNAVELLELDSNATVALLAYTRAQETRMTEAAVQVKRLRPELNASDRLIATTVDAAQGEEYDYVLTCILETADERGHVYTGRRSNVAHSRAKNGHICFVVKESRNKA